VAAAPKAPSALAVSKEGTFKPGLLLQGWYVYDDAAAVEKTFRVRRAEISAKGEIIPKRFAYSVMFDPAGLLEFQDKSLPVSPAQPMMPQTVTAKQPPGSISILRDMFVTYLTPVADVSIGQFRIPVGYESYNSSSRLLFPERAMVSTRLADRRDVGLRIAKQFQYVGYSAGLFNGTSVNATDNNDAKDGALRVEAYPVKGLLIAGVAYATLGDRNKVGNRQRYEADLRFERGPILFQGEYIWGRDVTAGPMGSKVFTRGQGFYAAAGVRFLEILQPVVRLSYLDPSTKAEKDHRFAYEGVINCYLRQFDARLQLAFSHFRNADSKKPAQNVLIFGAQAAY
jgi:hypothetical protein